MEFTQGNSHTFVIFKTRVKPRPCILDVYCAIYNTTPMEIYKPMLYNAICFLTDIYEICVACCIQYDVLEVLWKGSATRRHLVCNMEPPYRVNTQGIIVCRDERTETVKLCFSSTQTRTSCSSHRSKPVKPLILKMASGPLPERRWRKDHMNLGRPLM